MGLHPDEEPGHYHLDAEPGHYTVSGSDAALEVAGPLAMIGVAARALVEHAPAPGHDLPLDVRDPVAVGISGVVAVLAMGVGLRLLVGRLR